MYKYLFKGINLHVSQEIDENLNR